MRIVTAAVLIYVYANHAFLYVRTEYNDDQQKACVWYGWNDKMEPPTEWRLDQCFPYPPPRRK